MKILAVVGSPRKGGNTDVLVDQIILGAKENGAEVSKVYLNDLDLRPCQACDGCRDEQNPIDCVHNDDLVGVLKQLVESDGLIVGTPVYFFGPSAQTKVFLDRWYGLLKPPDHESPLKGKRLAMAIPYGDSDPFGAGATNTWGCIRDAATYMGMDIIGVAFGTANDPGEIRQSRESMDHALKLGRKM